MNHRPLISVLLPVYNCEEYLDLALRSVQAQTYENIEVLVLNDGSTDGSKEIIQSFCDGDPRFQLIDKTNTGLVDTLNQGIELAKGEFIARMDGDDICSIHRFETQIKHLEENPDCVGCAGDIMLIDDNGTSVRYHRPRPPAEANAFHVPAAEPYLPHPFLMVRTKILKKFRYNKVWHAEDADLYWRIAQDHRLDNIHNFLGEYRVHSGSVSSNAINGRIQSAFSQLCAISAQRESVRKPAISYPWEITEIKENATSLNKLINFLSEGLNTTELQFFKSGSSAKLLELSHWRRYPLSSDDYDFALENLFNVKSISKANRKLLTEILWRAYLTNHKSKNPIKELSKHPKELRIFSIYALRHGMSGAKKSIDASR